MKEKFNWYLHPAGNLSPVAFIAAVAAFLACTLLFAFFSPAADANSKPVFHVGYRVIDIPFPQHGQAKTLTVAVWYPTAKQPKPHTYGGPVKGNVSLNAEPLTAGGPYPLLVFSHGFGGGGTGSVFFTEALAAMGWIVAAPDHHDVLSAVRIREGQTTFDRAEFLRSASEIVHSSFETRGRYLYRVQEIKAVVDYMTSSEAYRRLVDPNRLAAGGHSLGGFTALGVCGTLPEYHDSRIRAVLLFSTGAGGYLYRREELQRVTIPLMLFMGERERSQKRGERTMLEISEFIYQAASGPKYFLEIRDANHFSFNNRFSEGLLSRWLGGTEEQFGVIRDYAIAFLQKYAAGNQATEQTPDQTHPLIVRCLKAP